MNIITLDGYSGSGKSTQLHLLATKLNYDIASYEQLFIAFRAMAEALPRTKEKDFGSINCIASMYAFHLMPNRQNCIFDHFWDKFFDAFMYQPDELTYLLRIFRAGLKLNQRREPDVSIFIDIPFQYAISRKVERNTGVIVGVRNDKCRDDFQERFWRIIECEVPYFHRVNGNQSVNDVTEDILSLIHREQERRHL